MTKQEAIRILKRIHEPEPYESQTILDVYTALEMAIEALEKQIPKEPMEEAHDEKTLSYKLYCPACERVIGYRSTITGNIAQKYTNESYCGFCGQAIDYGEGGE